MHKKKITHFFGKTSIYLIWKRRQQYLIMLICLPLISCFYLIVKAFFRHDETLESLFLCLAKHYSRKINIILYFWFYFIHRKVYKQYKLIFHFVLSTRSTFSYDDQYLQIKIGQNNEFIAHCSHSLTVMRSSFFKIICVTCMVAVLDMLEQF